MYKKRVLINSGTCDSGSFSPFCEEVRIARPMSYYVQGGVDLDGTSERPPLPAVYDSVDSPSDGVDIGTDVRVGRLDLADYASQLAGSKSAEAESAEDMADVD